MSSMKREPAEDNQINFDSEVKQEPLEYGDTKECEDWKTFNHNRKGIKIEADIKTQSQVLLTLLGRTINGDHKSIALVLLNTPPPPPILVQFQFRVCDSKFHVAL